MRNKIKEYRENKGISQGELAKLCNVSRQTINAIENNKYDPSLQLAFDLAMTLGTKVDNLFLDEEEENS
ncbi:helix-turn-helix transcriptional regulator [Oceanobacillus luteolus]|uniref:helix-turn-helix transcriptional regulator n=1 Tax=Oceanobacillus luteolus TaxID=1274358 RepID=UPI00203A6815|nr:helix-turn-helix transcriptional regulator [Oceanobacillus luteolus]MCM3740305.1 helix-turn-helix transcriptional regulator [Oceanobacillus luteolus]